MVQNVKPKAKDEPERSQQLKQLQQWRKEWFGIIQPVESIRSRQLIRHELLSAILMRKKPVWEWLRTKFTPPNLNRALLAVLGHHLKVENPSYFEIGEADLTLYTHCPDFQAILQLGCEYLELSEEFPKLSKKYKEQQLQKECKVFFCYPTTATTSQGFDDYAAPTEIENKLLMHSRSWVDEQLKLKNILKSYDGEESFEKAERFFQTKVEALKLLMSASLSSAKLERIQGVLKETGENVEVVTGPRELEELPRYRLEAIDSEVAAWGEVEAELQQGGKVLWIVNSVADCQRIYSSARDRVRQFSFPIATLIYHSRFRYQDAIAQHKKLINAFRGNEPAFAVTTQIAEMSLDISATLLVTANAPMQSLVQRLGRLNRWVTKTATGYQLDTQIKGIKPDGICRAIVYPWEKSKPYEPEDLKTGTQLVQALQGKNINQLKLAEQLERIDLKTPLTDEDKEAMWLQTWRAKSGELMPSTYTTQVILADDVGKIFQAADRDKDNKPWLEAQKWAVSVRIQLGKTEGWKRNKAFKFYRIAPTEDIHYHPEIGAYEPDNELLKERYGHQTEIKNS